MGDENVVKENNEYSINNEKNQLLLEAVTCNILGMKVKTIFDPTKDITSPNKRPFCNFIAKNMPMYIHPELMDDVTLRKQLFGNAADTLPKKDDTDNESKKKKDDEEKKNEKNIKKDDDDFIL